MTRKLKYLIFPLAVLLFSGFFKGDSDLYFQISKSIDIFGKVYKEVSFNYVDPINPEEFMISGINGMLSSLDPYTVFIDEKRKEDIDLLTNGKYGGIGVSIGIRNNKITIVDLLDGYSAQRQGLRIGDIILRVDNIEVNKDNFDEMSSLVKGEPGTEVKITILREEAEVEFNLIREEVKIKNLTFSGFMPENSNNVYLKLSSFTRTAGEEIKQALVSLKNEKPVHSVILDLRGNPGGLLDAAIDVCEKFLKKNDLIVTVMGRDSSSIKKYFSAEEPVAESTPLIVLVDNGSASASEIVAGAIQDHDRGILVGMETFGKGLVQTVVPLSYNTSLKITTAKYFTPSGRCIQKVDYSKNNKVLTSFPNGINTDLINISDYHTDNNRKVFAAGGIKPDTLVPGEIQSIIIDDFAAKGTFFKFATEYSASVSKDEFLSENPDVLFNKFKEFIKKGNNEFSSAAEKQISELITTAETEKYSKTILQELASLKEKFNQLKVFELENHKEGIIASIRSELFTRYEGQSGRIKDTLKNDKQFSVALDLINNKKIYTTLLND